MKTFKQIISEVAEPLGDDEKRFKAKHVVQKIDHPVADENQFTSKNTKKDKSKISGYKNGDDEIVYEATMMTCEDCGEEYDSEGECDCEDDDEEEDDDLDEATLTDTEKKRKEHIVTGMKKSEADLKSRYGDNWKSVMYAKATKNALHAEANQIGEAKKPKPGHNAAVMSKNISKVLSAVKKEEVELDEISNEKKTAYGNAAFADYHKQSKSKLTNILTGKDSSGESRKMANRVKGISRATKTEEVELDEISRDLARSYIRKVSDKKNTGQASPKEVAKRSAGVALAGKKAYDIGGKAKVKATESVDLDEAFKAGAMKLNDGSSVTLTNESSNALNSLFNQLTSTNKTKMEQKLMSGSKGFNEILAFAKEV